MNKKRKCQVHFYRPTGCERPIDPLREPLLVGTAVGRGAEEETKNNNVEKWRKSIHIHLFVLSMIDRTYFDLMIQPRLTDQIEIFVENKRKWSRRCYVWMYLWLCDDFFLINVYFNHEKRNNINKLTKIIFWRLMFIVVHHLATAFDHRSIDRIVDL